MAVVVFLRAVNVGTANRCRPAQIAQQLARFDVINIGAVGTFVVRRKVDEITLRAAIARKLPFKTEIMICRAHDLLNLWKQNPFSAEPAGPAVVRFVSVLAEPVRPTPPLPLTLPADDEWGVKVISIQKQFLLGLYRRQMKAIGELARLEKRLGVRMTTRNWNTIAKVVDLLSLEEKKSARAGQRPRD